MSNRPLRSPFVSHARSADSCSAESSAESTVGHTCCLGDSASRTSTALPRCALSSAAASLRSASTASRPR
eukprot:2681201-Prymnesium_polylepis.1